MGCGGELREELDSRLDHVVVVGMKRRIWDVVALGIDVEMALDGVCLVADTRRLTPEIR